MYVCICMYVNLQQVGKKKKKLVAVNISSLYLMSESDHLEEEDDNSSSSSSFTVQDVLKGSLGQVAVTTTTQLGSTSTSEDEILSIGCHDGEDRTLNKKGNLSSSSTMSYNTLGFRWMQSSSTYVH